MAQEILLGLLVYTYILSLNELTEGAQTTSAGRAFHSLTTRQLKLLASILEDA